MQTHKAPLCSSRLFIPLYCSHRPRSVTHAHTQPVNMSSQEVDPIPCDEALCLQLWINKVREKKEKEKQDKRREQKSRQDRERYS